MKTIDHQGETYVRVADVEANLERIRERMKRYEAAAEAYKKLGDETWKYYQSGANDLQWVLGLWGEG